MTPQRETLEYKHLQNCIQVALLTFVNPPVNLKNTEREGELNIKKTQAIHICLSKGQLITGKPCAAGPFLRTVVPRE